MEVPFTFGRVVSGREFTNRRKELAHLQANFSGRINTILISPRRWGKSSLVAEAARLAVKKDKSIRFCFVDLFNVRTEEEFYLAYATAVLSAMSTRTEELVRLAGKFLERFVPRLTFHPGGQTKFSLGLDWKEALRSPEDILNLSEKLAASKKLRLVVCLDEFQQVGSFPDHIAFQKRLRAQWQHHHQVSYCLYGSKKHMMMDVFTNPSMPFYKFGDIVFLDKIAGSEWVSYIVSRFEKTGKQISEEIAAEVALLAERHPYYVQQLAQLCWLRTIGKNCTKDILMEAYDSLLRQLGLIFQSLTDNLTATQINFLRAVTEGEEQFSSGASLEKYKLGTSGNVNRIKKALESREILDFTSGQPEFLDPMYRGWLEKYYFKGGTPHTATS